MSYKQRLALLFGVAGCLGLIVAMDGSTAQEPAPAPPGAQESLPPHIIRLRSRSSEVVPHHERDAQTAGGYIEVLHRSPERHRTRTSASRCS